MPTPPLSKEEAERRIKLVEDEYRAGNPPSGEKVRGRYNAIRVAAQKDGVSVGGTHSWYNSAVHIAGREADASLWERPAPDPIIPDGHHLEKATITVDAAGNFVGAWWKTATGKQNVLTMIEESVRRAMQDSPQIPIAKPPKTVDKDLIPWFQIGDAHLGMLAHEAETGANFDLGIAQRELCAAMAKLVDDAPACERCVINDLGDATHYENMAGVTEASGNPMDIDGRFPKMIDIYTATMRFLVDRALSKFKYVDVIINQGNHSRTNDIWAARYIRDLYEHTKRVHVLNNASVFIPYRMGNTFVLTHHGDKTRGTKLMDVMANDYRQDWGETQFHYIDTGHLHHSEVRKENGGARWEQWNTLAAKDKWHHEGGWRGEQSMTRVDRHKVYGETTRQTLSIRQLHEIVERAHDEAYIPPARREVYAV